VPAPSELGTQHVVQFQLSSSNAAQHTKLKLWKPGTSQTSSYGFLRALLHEIGLASQHIFKLAAITGRGRNK
jgi:hypothetical protein